MLGGGIAGESDIATSWQDGRYHIPIMNRLEPHMPRRRGLWARTVLLSTLLTAHAWAQQLSLGCASRQAWLNEPVTIEVQVRDFQQCQDPQLPASDDYILRSLGPPAESTFISIVNGRRSISRSRTYVFELTPRKLGTLRIGPAEAVVDGQTLRSNVITITVRRGESPIEAEITTEATRLFVGQQARFTLVLRVRPVTLPGSAPLGGGQMYSFLDPRHVGLGPFPPPRSYERIERSGPDGQKVLWYEYRLTTEAVLDRPGPVHFDALDMTVRYPTRLSRDLFGDLRVEGYRRIRLAPVIRAPQVEPLPEQGRPSGFTGAVGQFRITAHASPTHVRVGDPIELVIELTGEGPLSTLPGPDLTRQPALVRDFRVPSEPLAGTMVGRRRRFTQTIRARNARVREIPPIEYPYFDPVAAEYRIARTLPIPIEVTRTARLSADDVVGLAEAGAADPDALVPRAGLHEIRTDPQRLLARSPVLRPATVWLSLTLPPAGFGVFAIVLGLRRQQRLRPLGRQPRAALAEVRRALRQASAADADRQAEFVHAALLAYLARRLGMPPGGQTTDEVLSELRRRKLDPALLEALAQLLQRCEAARYAGVTPGCSPVEPALELLERLERQRW